MYIISKYHFAIFYAFLTIYTLFSKVKTKIKCIDSSTYYEHDFFNMTIVYLYIVSYRMSLLSLYKYNRFEEANL